ncbi:MAG TPA: AAA family ATPase [Candidatus Binataceae bacterium]|nr:AAA family ATPase [Candidatus Binataceae bacterium]
MTPSDAVRAACAIINERRAHKERIVVAIDGLGGAGKSTLARGIGDAFDGCVAIVSCDDFYRPLRGEDLAPEQAYERCFDWERLRDEAIAPLREGRRARYQRRDWMTDSLSEWVEVEAREIVVIEGVFSTRPELRALIDFSIFLETPRDERLRRMTARPQSDTSWMGRWMAAEGWYIAHHAPHRHADLLLQGF